MVRLQDVCSPEHKRHQSRHFDSGDVSEGIARRLYFNAGAVLNVAALAASVKRGLLCVAREIIKGFQSETPKQETPNMN
jgi:hypothetical protein